MSAERNKMQEIHDVAHFLEGTGKFEEDIVAFMKDAAIERLIREELEEHERESEEEVRSVGSLEAFLNV